MNKKVVVIGAGASGLMAALTVSVYHQEVLLLERNQKIGKKLLTTGNGRCNYTNRTLTENEYNHPLFVKQGLDLFGVDQTIALFESIGIYPKVENEGKVFPMSEQASSFIDVFLYELDNPFTTIMYEAKVTNIQPKNGLFYITLHNQKVIEATHVIVATGGYAMPKSGSDGTGYTLLQKLGHKVIKPSPGLVKLCLDFPYLKQLDGLKIDGTISLIANNQLIQVEHGDILFTSYGISGPTILQLSSKIKPYLDLNQEIMLDLHILSKPSKEEVLNRMYQFYDKPIHHSLIGLVHKRLIPVILKCAGIESLTQVVSSLDHQTIEKVVNLLYHFPLKVIGTKDFDEAQVTLGGISTHEVNPQTMESLLIPNLYITGELLDIDGICGGYNLQWAWTSGYLAGKNAALKETK